jgi:hypothetical protein
MIFSENRFPLFGIMLQWECLMFIAPPHRHRKAIQASDSGMGVLSRSPARAGDVIFGNVGSNREEEI